MGDAMFGRGWLRLAALNGTGCPCVGELETIPAGGGVVGEEGNTPSISWRRAAWKEERLDNLP